MVGNLGRGENFSARLVAAVAAKSALPADAAAVATAAAAAVAAAVPYEWAPRPPESTSARPVVVGTESLRVP